MKIGLVLSNTPGYSETFFINKIKFLKEEGYGVKLFVSKSDSEFNLCPTHEGLNLGSGRKKKITSSIKTIALLILSFHRAIKLWRANRNDGFSYKNNTISILNSAHILRHKLDWLHFGFATMAVGRENLASIIGAKMAVSNRGYDVYVYPLKHQNAYHLLWKRLDKLHYLSQGLLKAAIKLGFSNDTAHQKITPAVNIDDFNNPSVNRKGYTNKYIITTVARLHWIKGLEYTLEALSILHKAGVDFQYKIIGSGDEYERLKFASYQLGIMENVNFCGKLSQNEIQKQLNHTDIYLQYSIQEGFCNAVLEAQAMGCLCIVSDAEGLSENVLNNQTGFVIPKRNPKKLFEKIREVLEMDESDLTKIKENAIQRVREEFNLEKQKQEFLKFYQN